MTLIICIQPLCNRYCYKISFITITTVIVIIVTITVVITIAVATLLPWLAFIV